MDQFKFKVGEQVTYIGNSFGTDYLGIGTVIESFKLDWIHSVFVRVNFNGTIYTTIEDELQSYSKIKTGFGKWISNSI